MLSSLSLLLLLQYAANFNHGVFSFHKIELLAVRKNFTLRVNGGTARSIVNEGKNDFLNVRR